MRKTLLSLCAAVLVAFPLTGSITGLARVEALAGDAVLVGAGDIASCTTQRDEATAKLLDQTSGTVITLGDNAYPDGSLSQMKNCYGPTWGRHRSRTRPSLGNHEYHTSGAAGYFSYFGNAGSPSQSGCTTNCKGYYSYSLGTWHVVVLNSQLNHAAGSPQEKWLRADLARNGKACTLAYWHYPRFSSGSHSNTSHVAPFWNALYDYGVDVVLNGHDHLYERFAPQNPQGKTDSAHGIRQFIVGTGGASLYPYSSIKPNSQVRNNKTWGVLKLTLRSGSYDWKFIPIAGQTFSDAGSAKCVAPAASSSSRLLTSVSPAAREWVPPHAAITILADGFGAENVSASSYSAAGSAQRPLGLPTFARAQRPEDQPGL